MSSERLRNARSEAGVGATEWRNQRVVAGHVGEVYLDAQNVYLSEKCSHIFAGLFGGGPVEHNCSVEPAA